MSDQPPIPVTTLEVDAETLAHAEEKLKQLDGMGLLTLEAQLLRQKNLLEKGTPEFPCVAWMDLYTAHGDKVSLTMRGYDPVEVMDDLVLGITYAGKRYNLLPQGKRHAQAGPAPAPVVPASPAPVIPAPVPAPQYHPVASPADPGKPVDSKGNYPGKTFTEQLAMLEVTPIPGGVKVGLFPYLSRGGMGKYATTYEQVRSPEEWVQLFTNRVFLVGGQASYLTVQHFMVAGRYEVPQGTIEVEFICADRTNQKGNYYTNLNRVMPPV